MFNHEQTATNQPQITHIDLTGLPVQIQIELMDYYEFLITKYQVETGKSEPQAKFRQFLDNPIQVAQLESWTREQLHER